MRKLTEKNFADAVDERFKTEKTCLVFFAVPWCAPCDAVRKVLEALEEKRGTIFFEVDAEESETLVEHYGVKAIPSLLFLREDGSMFMPATVPLLTFAKTFQEIFDA